MYPKINIYQDRCGFISQLGMNEQVPALQELVTFYHHDTADPQTVVRLSYDHQRLYIHIHAFSIEHGDDLQGDGIEILFKPSQQSGTIQSIMWMYHESAKPFESELGPEVVPFTSFEVAAHNGEGYWSADISIPFSSVNIEKVGLGDVWEFNLLRYIIGARPASSWIPIRHSFFSDDDEMYQLKANVTEEGRTGKIIFGDQSKTNCNHEAELKYVGYKQKQITFKHKDSIITKVLLKWKDPSGEITEIEPSLLTGDSLRTKLDFNHPEPLRNGWYEIEIIAEDQLQRRQSLLVSFDRISLIRAGKQFNEIHGSDIRETARLNYRAPSKEVQQLLKLIPEKLGFTFTGLPDQSDLWPYNLLEWDSSKPQHLTSIKSTLIYPNPLFIEDKTIGVMNLKGQKLEYPYYEDSEGNRFFLSAHVWKRQNEYVLHQTELLAERDPLGAARIIYRYAQMYEGYVPVYDYPWINYPMKKQAGPPYPYWGGMWSRWFYMDLYVLRHLSIAFEKVIKTNAFELISEEQGEEVTSLIIERMFKPSVQFVESYPNMDTNMDFARWLGLVYLGKAINEPDYIHEAVENMDDFVKKQFLFDGSWKEVTLSYHQQTVTGLEKVAVALENWSDPKGYLSPRNGKRLDHLDMKKRIPKLKKSIDFLHKLTFPNGRFLPIMDTWGYDRIERSNEKLGPLLMPAAGIARLTRGQGEGQSQVYLSFVPKYGHNHLDPLHLTLFANKQELLPDIGYTHTKYKYSAVCTLGHNTVLVDGMDMVLDKMSVHGGNIDLFVPSEGNLQIMGASYPHAYPQVKQYGREVWFVGLPGSESHQGYTVDIFRVCGGEKHEYTLHGDPDHDGVWLTDIPLENIDGILPKNTKITYPHTENEKGFAEGHYSGYIFLKDVKRAYNPSGRYQITLATRESNQQASRLKIICDSGGEKSELFLGTWPSLRATRIHRQDTNDQADQYVLPKLVLRKEGNHLKSMFVTLMEPHEPKQEQVDEMEVIKRTDSFVAVKVTSGGITDILFSQTAETPSLVSIGDIQFNGKKGFIRMENHQVKQMALVGGTLLQKGSLQITGSGTTKGIIKKTLSQSRGDEFNAFITKTDIPDYEKFTYIIIIHPDGKTHGYPMTGALKDERGTILLTGDFEPGFSIEEDGNSCSESFPQIRWEGQHFFYLDSYVDIKFF